MKKIFALIMVLVMGGTATFAFSACSDSDTEPSESNVQSPSDDSERTVNEDAKALLQAAQEEILTSTCPEIDGTIEDLDSYDVVFVGYPNWNADMPYILYTFFEAYDFQGKQLYLSIPTAEADFRRHIRNT